MLSKEAIQRLIQERTWEMEAALPRLQVTPDPSASIRVVILAAEKRALEQLLEHYDDESALMQLYLESSAEFGIFNWLVKGQTR